MTAKKRFIMAMEVLGIMIGLIFFFPFYIMLVNSLKTKPQIFKNTLNLPGGFEWINYVEAFKQLEFLHAFANSLFITAGSILLLILCASMAGWKLVRTKSRLSGIIFLMFVSAILIPFQSVMLPLITIMGKLGFLNRLGLIFMYLGFGSSLSLFLYHGFVKSVPKELDEAAIIDGCNEFQVFGKVIFPILTPITLTVIILLTIWIWNDYLLPSLVINKEGMQTIPLQMFFFFGEYTKQWHLALAGLTLAIIPVIIFYFSAQKYIIRGVTQGAIK
jgi:raffinose/stachyose/melibiose transport system permease protein